MIPQQKDDSSPDILIVGAGPVGLVTSLLLANQGHRIVLIEKWSAPYPLPRAIGMSHESLRILHWARATDQLDSVMAWDERYLFGELLSSTGETLLKMPFKARAESGWPEMRAFNQPDAEAVLDELVRAHPNIRFLRGKRVTTVRQDATAAEIRFVAADSAGVPQLGAPEQVLRASYLIGCDGANSTVFQSLNVPVTDLGFEFDWLVVDIEPKTERQWSPFLGQLLGPRRPVSCAPSGPGRRRFEFMRMPGESREQMSDAATAWRLLSEQGVTPENATLQRQALYTFRARWVERWRKDRILLAGDAAHLTPPFLAQGLNSGIRDAATLAWRLDLVLRGIAPPQTLEDYGVERAGHVRAVIEEAVSLGRLICTTDPAECEERDGLLRYLRDNPHLQPPRSTWRIGPGARLPDDPNAGVLGRQGRVRLNGRTGQFDDVCGVGRFVLLARQGDPTEALSVDVRRMWERLSGIAVHIGANAPVFDLDGCYEEWFNETGSEVILVRPDFYVFGTGRAITDANDLVVQLAARLQISSSGAAVRDSTQLNLRAVQ